MTREEAIKAITQFIENYASGNDLVGLTMAIEALKEQRPKWTPCSERLPEKHGYYIVMTDGSHNSVIDIAEFGRCGNLIWGWNKASEVIAWMPLPEPYKEEGEPING